MKPLALSMVATCSCLAAIGNFRVMGTTATQALINYTAPDGKACTIQLSQSATMTPLALDVDPGAFAGSDSDLSRPSTVTTGLSRTLLLGQRTSQYATAGTYSGVRHFSRALQAYTPYFGKITCPSTGDTQPFTFSTGNIPLGSTYGDPWLSDPAHPGDQPWPESLGALTPESFIDPLTGTEQYRIGLRGNDPSAWTLSFGSAFNQGQTTPCDTGGPWTSPCNVTAGSGATTVGNSTAPLVLRPPLTVNNPWNTNYNSTWSLDQLSVSLTGYVNSTTTTFRVLDVCLSLNGGASCASSTQQLTMGQTSGQQTVGQADSSQFGVLPWLLDTNPRLNAQESSAHSGTASVTNNSGTYTVTNNNSGDLFSLYWITGGNGSIRLSSNNDACLTPPATTTSVEYRIASFADGKNLVLASGTPPTGSNIYWCENNFTIMVWRDHAPTDGSVVTLTSASMSALGSYAPGYPDNGAGTACFDKQVYGGYFCLYGGLYWINPAAPDVAYWGFMQASGVDRSGTPITNSWSRTGGPYGNGANIDQTQPALTFYMAAQDPAGNGPLVIQGVFSPSATPSQPTTPQSGAGVAQIANANVTSTTPYAVTWSVTAPSPWSMTWTNLTPQSSMPEGVVQQMATFDPTFVPSYYNRSLTGGWNCNLSGAVSLGIFFFPCYSLGGDSPAWLFAFSPGDGNPAHAGMTGGPQIIGAINTFNTPSGPVAPGQGALTGRSFHALVEGGETGWVEIDCNEWNPINTSNTSIPASGPAKCSTFAATLSATADCIAIQMNSYTSHSVTGYEPYFASPFYPPFLGTPGELRTTQVGDTACVSTSSTACSWADQSNELLTLRIKNYGGTPGLWVFQRGAYGVERALASGATFRWESYQSVTPPGTTNANQAVAVWWNPLTGCGGSPDPHGNCLLQDTNTSIGHGEWRNNGEAVTVNVPAWGFQGAMSFISWPTDYQTIVGSPPAIFSYPPANSTPNQAPEVNFVSGSPPFAGAFGVPFQPDGGSHPNAAGAHAPTGVNGAPYEALQAFDNIPVQGGAYDPPFTSVAGQLYRYRPGAVTDPDDFYTAGSVAYINRKLMATGAACGSHPLIDRSGPGSSMGTDTSGSYSYCVARANGECYSGSNTGDVYVNCPGVINAYCSGVATHGGAPVGVGNDICVGNISNVADAIIQFTLAHTDYSWSYGRNLASATSRLRMVNGFENNALLPDNSWILYRQEYLNYQRQEMWMARLPPYPPTDSVVRGTFVPVSLALKPPAGLGVNNAIVEFGYQEYGAPQFINCTTRNDACISTSTASTVPPGNQPFYFASENPAGAPCATGCTITIPAISQRILYYQIQYRAANNMALSAGPLTAVLVP